MILVNTYGNYGPNPFSIFIKTAKKANMQFCRNHFKVKKKFHDTSYYLMYIRATMYIYYSFGNYLYYEIKLKLALFYYNNDNWIA